LAAYLVRRVLLIIPTLLLVTVLVFLMVRAVPGSIIDIMAAEHERVGATQIDDEAIRHMLGLDEPLHVQYGRWIAGIVTRGDFGDSMWTNRPVTSEIIRRLPVSFELGLLAIIIAVLLAIPIGVYSAMRQDGVGDYVGRSLAIGMLAIPGFWLATLVMVFPAIWWGWSPPMEYIPFLSDPLGNLGQFLLPAFLMGAAMSAATMRMTRTMALEVLRQDYIRTAWSKGLSERAVIIRHALKNALIPVITVIGLQVPVLIGGSVIMEQIFTLPGLGRLIVDVVKSRDYTMISGVNVFLASFVLLANLVVDLSYAYLDPRIRYK